MKFAFNPDAPVFTPQGNTDAVSSLHAALKPAVSAWKSGGPHKPAKSRTPPNVQPDTVADGLGSLHLGADDVAPSVIGFCELKPDRELTDGHCARATAGGLDAEPEVFELSDDDGLGAQNHHASSAPALDNSPMISDLSGGLGALSSMPRAPSVPKQIGVTYDPEGHPHLAVCPADFQALREIGEGAFGKVYLVKARFNGGLYAMKVLNKQTVLRKEQAAYAKSERDVMSRLQHPYLVSLRYSFQTSSRLFLVMDYIEGGHLWLHMKSGFFSEDVACVFGAEMVLAIGHLHSMKIAHRDLKPENILLDSSNHLRLTDFGLAKAEMTEDCRAHTMVGTIDYMAPEVVKNDGHGREVDWWSLGVLLYEMLFAKLPFAPIERPGDKKARKLDPANEAYKAEVKKRILTGKVVFPKGRFVNAVSKLAKDFIVKLLHKSPRERLGAGGVEQVMAHPFFCQAGRAVNWDALMERKVKSPLASSIFKGAPDRIGAACIDPVPHPHDEHPSAKLAGYLFEKDTPVGSPRGEDVVELFRGFSYVQPSELMHAMGGRDPFGAF